MTDPFADVAAVLDEARRAWVRAEMRSDVVDGMTGAALAGLNDAMGRLRRQVDAVHAKVAAQIERASRPELGAAGLARQQGFRTAAAMIAAATGAPLGEGGRLVAVGTAIEPRPTLTGEVMPARRPHVAEALQAGLIGVSAAAAIVALLDKVALRAEHDMLDHAERVLCDQAVGLPLDQLQRVLSRAEAWLDPDGVAEREGESRSSRYLKVWTDRAGRVRLDGAFDPESGAPVVAAIDGMVGEYFRTRQCGAEAVPSGPEGVDDIVNADDPRSMAQMKADALVQVCAHALDCDSADVPTGGATVVVRIDLDDLESGRGFGLVDGIDGPVSVETVRRMAADAKIIPCVLDGQGEILDWGRARRLFTRAQKLALVERDGGCAMCGLPPGMTQVHHIRWWERDTGPTDLDNGIVLCLRCHHRIHDDGWGIEIRGKGARGQVWFMPPAHVDPSGTPRRGGRARFDYRTAA